MVEQHVIFFKLKLPGGHRSGVLS